MDGWWEGGKDGGGRKEGCGGGKKRGVRVVMSGRFVSGQVVLGRVVSGRSGEIMSNLAK